jgi:hypothetical protein
MFKLNVMVRYVTFLPHILEVLGSYLDLDSAYPD